jgi:uncharacterized phage-associated protein
MFQIVGGGFMGVMPVLDVAHFFLTKNIPNTKKAITHLKLQKLVYYAQSFYLAFDFDEKLNDLLFDDHLEAWTHGPVSSEVYKNYQSKGNRFEELAVFEDKIYFPNTCVRDMLDCVWHNYGGFSGSQLEYFTHREDPWLKARARAGVKPWEPSNEVIRNGDMKAYYKSLL